MRHHVEVKAMGLELMSGVVAARKTCCVSALLDRAQIILMTSDGSEVAALVCTSNITAFI